MGADETGEVSLTRCPYPVRLPFRGPHAPLFPAGMCGDHLLHRRTAAAPWAPHRPSPLGRTAQRRRDSYRVLHHPGLKIKTQAETSHSRHPHLSPHAFFLKMVSRFILIIIYIFSILFYFILSFFISYNIYIHLIIMRGGQQKPHFSFYMFAIN